MTDLANSTTQDLVCILDGDSFEQLFVAASPMRMSVRESKKVTQFAVEDGTIRSDHVVADPVEITIDFVFDAEGARDGYAQIRQAWRENRLVIVQGKVSSYSQMLIADMPHDESPEYGMGIAMPIRLVEWRTVTPQYGSLPPTKVKDKKQADTSKGGEKQTAAADQSKTNKASVAYRLFGNANN